ncbi:MAG: AraC family transcriptional regulator [Blautia sp.]|nr:AraC family transcriptional regulator [Blautia sp.]
MQIVTDGYQKELKKHGTDEFPLLVSYEQLSRYGSGSFLWHWHPELEITLILEGKMIYKVNQCTFHLKEGEILFSNANVLHAGFMENMEDCKYYSLTFDPKMVYGFYQSVLKRRYVDPVTQNFYLPAIYIDYSEKWHREFSEYVKDIIRLNQEKPVFYEMDIVGDLRKLWKCMLKNQQPASYSQHSRSEQERMKIIMEYLEQNYMNKIRLSDISSKVHLCESECSRLFKKYMNVSLFTFLQEYRVERSLEFLLGSGDSITEVAQKAGFTDSNYYSKVFSRIKGCSPCKYRKEKINLIKKDEKDDNPFSL